jgi:uncharacterized protein
MKRTAEHYIQHLNLQPHPEGGYYKEVYRSALNLPSEALPPEFGGTRQICTSIYFLIEQGNFSAFHRIRSDETWHFYDGDALEVIELQQEGRLKKTAVGRNLPEGEQLQYTVKANTWFASRVKEGGHFSLVGCTVSPGFDFTDFEMAERKMLLEKYPQHKNEILGLTRI